MEQQTPIPQIKDEAARGAKRATFPSLNFFFFAGGGGGGGGGGEGGLGFPLILSTIVALFP